jgi:hypothetical protein
MLKLYYGRAVEIISLILWGTQQSKSTRSQKQDFIKGARTQGKTSNNRKNRRMKRKRKEQKESLGKEENSQDENKDRAGDRIVVALFLTEDTPGIRSR